MRYTFLLYSDPAMAANMTEEDWAKSKEIYGQYIGALQEAGVFVDTDWLPPAEKSRFRMVHLRKPRKHSAASSQLRLRTSMKQ
jgi:hypothetical protein